MKTLVKRITPRFNGLPSIFDDLFFSEEVRVPSFIKNFPAVNIQENENAFTLEFVLPGYQKEDLEIKVENNLLTISSEKKSEGEVNEKNYTRKEFSFSSFTRSFTLPEIVDVENIDAKNKEGILYVTLPKNEELLKSKAKSIDIK
jgi:HSP20 family protein